MVTVREVALKAGVSVGTVSRVLSNNSSVKQHLRDRVQQAVKDLSYKPNLAARALRTNRVDVIGLLVPDITNPFFAQLALNIETEAAKHGHSVMLANSHDDPETEAWQLETLLDRTPRAVLIAAASDSGRLEVVTDVPIISLDRRYGRFPLIATDHADGSRQVADHLFELGHRSIAYISGPQNTEVARLREDGFVTRIGELNSRQDPVTLSLREGQFDYESGETIGREILGAPSRPSAIAAASDQMAIGVLRAARDLQIDVPERLSVVGFDDIALAHLVVPRLTSIRQQTAKLAEAALACVFAEAPATQDVKIQARLVVRGSTSKAFVQP